MERDCCTNKAVCFCSCHEDDFVLTAADVTTDNADALGFGPRCDR